MKQHITDTRHAIDEALRQLRPFGPIPWDTVEEAAFDVIQSEPSAEGQSLIDRIAEVAIKKWTEGTAL